MPTAAGHHRDDARRYQALGWWEDALAAADAAVDAGLDMQPDPRCLRAEILMRAGRVAEAEPIWAAVRADTPDDVWLYNTAGLEYADTGDHAKAVRWSPVPPAGCQIPRANHLFAAAEPGCGV